MATLGIHKFDMNKMLTSSQYRYPFILVIGESGSGKTSVCHEILRAKQNTDIGIAYLPAEYGEGSSLGGIFASTFVFEEFETWPLVELRYQMARQQILKKMQHSEDDDDDADNNNKKKRRKKRGGRAAAAAEKRKEALREVDALVMADDITFASASFFRNEDVKYLINNGRHLRTTFIATAQDMMSIDKRLRTQARYVFVFDTADESRIESIWKQWFSVVPTFALFRKIFKEMTRNYGCLVYRKVRGQEISIANSVFWYRAPAKLKPFHIGSEMYWRHHYANCISEREQLQRLDEHRRAKRALYEKNNKLVTQLKKNAEAEAANPTTRRVVPGSSTTVSRRNTGIPYIVAIGDDSGSSDTESDDDRRKKKKKKRHHTKK